MRKMLLFLVFSCALVMAVTASANAACKEKCARPKASPGTPQVILDANSGKLVNGSLRLPQTNNVDVVFVNKNPFRHLYRFDIRTTPLEEGIAIGFLSQIADFKTAAAGLSTAESAGCQPAKDDVTALTNALTAAETAATNAKPEIDNRKAAAKRYNEFLELTDTDPIQCEKVCEAAGNLTNDLELLMDLGKLPDLARTLAKAVADAKTKLDLVQAKIDGIADPIAKEDCVHGVAPLKARYDILTESNVNATDSVKEWQEKAKGFEKLAEIINNLDDESFVESRNVITSGATLATVEIGVRDLDKKNSPERVYMAQIQVGESRLSVSGGVGFSTIEDVTFVRQKALINDKLVDVFAEENSSSFKPNPVVMLNANIGRAFSFLDIHSAPTLFSWSLGIVLASRNDSTQTEYITGPSLGFIDNHVIFTVGYHAARVAKLGGNFRVGDPIPEGLADPLPVTQKWAGGVMFGVTYRFR